MADGVGGWRTYGIDPSLFPQSLMAVCERLVREGRFEPQQPVNILSASYHEVQQDKVPLIGMQRAMENLPDELSADRFIVFIIYNLRLSVISQESKTCLGTINDIWNCYICIWLCM